MSDIKFYPLKFRTRADMNDFLDCQEKRLELPTEKLIPRFCEVGGQQYINIEWTEAKFSLMPIEQP